MTKELEANSNYQWSMNSGHGKKALKSLKKQDHGIWNRWLQAMAKETKEGKSSSKDKDAGIKKSESSSRNI